MSRPKTYGELADYAKSQFTLTETTINDYRPAGDFYIDDIAFPVKCKGAGERNYVSIPNGIRFWLKNGDSIIYVRRNDDEDGEHE